MAQIEVLKFKVRKGSMLPFGVRTDDSGDNVQISIWIKNAKKCNLCIYRNERLIQTIPMLSMQEEGASDIFSLVMSGDGIAKQLCGLDYIFEADGVEFVDPYAKRITGREIFGKQKKCRAKFCFESFCWEGEGRKQISFNEMILYQCHVRGFTKHHSSNVSNPGTFHGLTEKISYLKELGVNTLLLLPIYEFDENEFLGKGVKKINYWGYTREAFYFAPKSSFAGSGNSPVLELKQMVKALHENGMNLFLDMHFNNQTPDFILECLRYYVMEFHIDGFLLNQDKIDARLVANDPILRHIKLLGTGWEETDEKEKRLACFNDGFLVDARRFLKSDEGMVWNFYQRFKAQGNCVAVINYITQKNGFTLQDLVSYDIKHNEDNGERNSDGTEFNYSWNCGAEGRTRKRKVQDMRKQQVRNALAMLILSLGTPMLLAGDEFGNTQEGNNNAYCQDNRITWLDWNLLDRKRELFEYTKLLLSFRKQHPVYHGIPLQGFDYKGYGAPDISCHGLEPWTSNFVNYSRELGILFYGSYFAEEDLQGETVYIAFNMHWERHEFFLPTIRGGGWKCILDTSVSSGKNCEVVKDKYVVDPRSIAIFTTIPDPDKKVT